MGRKSSGRAPDSEDAARFFFRLEQPGEDTATLWTLLTMLPAAAAMGVGAWAIDRYTQAGLGLWRYVLVVPMAVFAIYGGLMSVLVLCGLLGDRFSDRRARGTRLPFRSTAAVALVELALAVAAYVFLKPLIGYWCLIPVVILGYLAATAAVAATLMFAVASTPERRESDEPAERRRWRGWIVLQMAVGVFLVAEPFFIPHTTERMGYYVFTVFFFVGLVWRDRGKWFRVSADVPPPESDQPEDE